LAGDETDVKASAINNRGILHHEIQDEDKAFADWSHVIETDTNSDERVHVRSTIGPTFSRDEERTRMRFVTDRKS